MTLAQTISMHKSDKDDKEKEDVVGISTKTVPRIASGHASSTKEFKNEDTFEKFHKHLDHLTPSHLRLPSFQLTLRTLQLKEAAYTHYQPKHQIWHHFGEDEDGFQLGKYELF